jgi:nucleoside-diphosphate-sugar epimerase
MKILLTGGTGLIGRHLIPGCWSLASRNGFNAQPEKRKAASMRASPCGAISTSSPQ